MRRVALALATVMITVLPAHAGFKTGNALYNYCEKTDNSALVLYGYVQGLFDYNEALPEYNKTFCLPAGSTAQQLTDVLCLYMKNHPANRNWNAAALAHNAYVEAWPCPKQ